MSRSEIIIDEQALATVSEGLKAYVTEYKEALESAIRILKQNCSEWNDEDFNSLVSAISSFLGDVDSMEMSTTQLINRIDKKIVAIHELHNMKI